MITNMNYLYDCNSKINPIMQIQIKVITNYTLIIILYCSSSNNNNNND